MNNIKPLLHLLSLCLLLTGCANVKLVSTWKDPAAKPKSYRQLLVVGVTENTQTRQIFEEVMAAEFRKQGVAAVPSYTMTGVEEKLSVALVEKAVKTSDVDGVLVTRIIDTRKKTHTDVGYNMTTRGIDGYAGIYGSGTISYATFDLAPVEITTSTTTAVETSLFDRATKGIVWQGVTDAVDPKGIITGSEKVAGVIANELRKERLIQ
jgi:hypothetical protein